MGKGNVKSCCGRNFWIGHVYIVATPNCVQFTVFFLHTVYSLVIYFSIMVAGRGGGSRSPQWLRSRTQIFKLIKCNWEKGIIILFFYNFFWVFLWFWILATFTPGLLQFIIINLFEKLTFPTDIYFQLIYSWQNPFVYNSMLIINDY